MQIRSFSSLMESYERLIARPNPANDHFYNGLYTRYRYPVLTLSLIHISEPTRRS